jgi:signal transduction histidine kinase
MIHGEPQHSTATRAARAGVLIVDDDDHIAEALSIILEGAGYDVTRCDGALEALKYLRAGNVPELILFDLMMPSMNGWEFRVELRREPCWADIPVIAMSADGSAQAAAIDADLYLKKPIDDLTLLRSVESLLENAQQKREDSHRAELERLSSLGLIAAGIAHEINNPLAFIVGNLELARKHLRELEGEVEGLSRARVIALSRLLDHADKGAQRIAEVGRSVAAFSRPDVERAVLVNAIDVLESSIQLAENEIRHRATLTRDYRGIPEVLANPAKLGQVFLNLLTNAAHAVEDGMSVLREIRVAAHTNDDGHAVIAISDNGQGISHAHLARIFDPFFSTKASGAGMGLGLPISQRIVAGLGGSLTVQSELGTGSTFIVTLPAAHVRIAANEASASAKGTRRPKLLVIDDEPMMCDLLEGTLSDDYEVETQKSARDALNALLRGESYDLILCDLMMPDLSGMDLHTQLSRLCPDQAERMVFMTGGTFTERAQAFVERLSCGYLAKPFRTDEAQALIDARLSKLGLSGANHHRVN